MTDTQKPFDAAVIIPTVLRPSLARAVRSVFAQDCKGRIQIMIGIDKVEGDRTILDTLRVECPQNMAITVMDLGYSTAQRNGGLYTSFAGGALRTILSYAANSRHIAYLDDDNWFAPYHLSDLLEAVQGKAWAYSLRWFVDPGSVSVLCVDDFVSVGPGRGLMKNKLGGFVDGNCLLIDKVQCDNALYVWCEGEKESGAGGGQLMYAHLSKNFPCEATHRPSVYCATDLKRNPEIQAILKQRGFDPAKAKPATAPAMNLQPFRGKVFVVGLPRTGLKQLCLALSFLGYRPSLIRTGELDADTMSGQNVFAGMPVASGFRQLDQQWPGSKFILTLGSAEGKSHEAFDQHRQAVLAHFDGRPQDLLVLDVLKGEGWEKLCPFLNHRRPQYPFPKAEPKSSPAAAGN